MAITVTQALAWNGGFASPTTVSFTSDFVTHEAAGSGSNPAEGSTLLVFVGIGATVTAVETNQGDAGVLDYQIGTNRGVWRIEDISASVTSITVTHSTSSGSDVWVLELPVAVTENDNSAFAADGQGFVTAHTLEYTTAESGELVVAMAETTAGNRDWTDGTDGTVLAASNSDNNALIYSIIPTATTGDIDWSTTVASSVNSGLISYQEVAASGGATLPLIIQYYG